MPTSATAATRRPGTGTPSTTAGTSSSCSTATVSTHRRRCPTCSRRSPTPDAVDAVFGSRMLDPGGARRGGMPLYKYVGNRILTRTQNVIAGVRLSEWHSGYRAYRVSALADLPFVGNSDGFDFDTEIILQLLGSDRQIRRGPDPHLLRRRDLAGQRDRLRPRHRHRHGPPPPRARSASAAATSATRTSPTRTSRRPTARTASCSISSPTAHRCGCSTSGAGPAGWPPNCAAAATTSPAST